MATRFQPLFEALSNTKAMLTGDPDDELDVFPSYVGKNIDENPSVFSAKGT